MTKRAGPMNMTMKNFPQVDHEIKSANHASKIDAGAKAIA
jgi:hypothetical protein